MKILREWRSKVYHVNTTDEFYSSPEWRKLRRDCFARDNWRCLRCDKRFRSEALNAHHMTPRLDGGVDDLTNLVSLCNECHDFVEISGFRNRAEIIGSYEKPATEKPEPPKSLDDIDSKRPAWHKFVYGGVKRKS